jgi:hypothetical protein
MRAIAPPALLTRYPSRFWTAPRNHDPGEGAGHMTPEAVSIFGANYDPPESLWLKVFLTGSEEGHAAGRTFLQRYLPITSRHFLAGARNGGFNSFTFNRAGRCRTGASKVSKAGYEMSV